MKKLKTMTIFGTRPEVIKLAPVIFALDQSPHFDSVLVTTGQHREMLDQALDQFGISPHFNLDIMKPGQGVSDVTIDSLQGIEELVVDQQPDLVLVQGDTTTAFAGCLAAFYQKTSIGHVEAGLRTYDKYRPFPEEINRSLITQLADVHFVPTGTAWESLRREGIPEEKIFVTGNTVIDALFHVIDTAYKFQDPRLRDLDGSRRIVVVTSHRRENFGQPLRDICQSIDDLVRSFPDIEVVFSVHRNPKVNVPVHEALGGHDRIHLVEPLGYADMANLISRSHLVLTDSGGLQEEAPALAKPVLVMRDTTERPEAVQAGMARLVGTSRRSIVSSASLLLSDPISYRAMSKGISPYGDGQAARRIIEAIEYINNYRDHAPQPFVSLSPVAVTGEQLRVERALSNELFYRQLDELIEKARLERQMVSTATFDLTDSTPEQFSHAVRAITRSLRETDTAAAHEGVEGKKLVLVLPGAGEKEAIIATDRLKQSLRRSMMGRRASDRGFRSLPKWAEEDVQVDIKTYGQVTLDEKPRRAASGRRRTDA